MTTPIDELVDVVDRQDNVIGQQNLSTLYAEGASNFRGINVFLINDQGQLWLPRRTATKKRFPSCLDFSCGGHVQSGESYDEALRRELEEELNLNIDEVPYRFLGHLTPHQHNVALFTQVYEIPTNQTPAWNREDFVEAFWLEPSQAMSWLEKGEPAKSDLPKLIQLFYLGQK